MSKHTPGPWNFYDDSNDGKTNRIEIVAIGKTVARIYHSEPSEDLPNARLIAAAPDLLKALKVMVRDMQAVNAGGQYGIELEPALHQAQAAIDKAEGQK